MRKGSRSGANVKIKIRKLEKISAEKSFFIQNNLTDFEKLSNLSDLDINEIQRKSSLCTLNNLKKIRAIAIFKKEIGISPPQAYLLLHCGISSIKSLSLSTPYELERKIGRLERILRVKTETDITFALLKEWIKKGAVVIDAGYHPEKCGDIDLDGIEEIASSYTPVPGGVGPMTINTLILNTMEAARKTLN